MNTVNESYAEIFRDLTSSAKQLIQSEVALIKTEAKEIASEATANVTQAILFGALIIASVVPLLASAVIALGQLWDGNYALSALVVGLGCATVGGVFFYRAIKRMGDVKVAMPAATESLKDGSESVQRKSAQLTDAVAGV